MKVGPFTLMIAFGVGDEFASLVHRSERGYSQGVPLLLFCSASRWHEYQDLRRQYYWSGIKKHVADFVRQCLTCQQVKIEHQRPAGLL